MKNILIVQPDENLQQAVYDNFRNCMLRDFEKGILVLNKNVNYQIIAVDDITVK